MQYLLEWRVALAKDLLRTERPTVIHHRRGDGDLIETRIVTAGSLDLDPPGITLDLDRIYG